MSLFSKHGEELRKALSAVQSEGNDIAWLILSYDRDDQLKVTLAEEDEGLDELCDSLEVSKVQYAYAKVIDPNSKLSKYVFITMCGEGAKPNHKTRFNTDVNKVREFLKIVHVQVDYRRSDDVQPASILDKVAKSSGSNYDAQASSEKRRPVAAVTPVNSVYKKTEIPDIAAMQRESMKKDGPPARVGTNHQRIETNPRRLQHTWGAPQSNEDTSAAAVRAEREKNERETREREAQHARDREAKNKATEQLRLAQEKEREEAARRGEEEQRRRQEEEQRRQGEEEQRRQLEEEQRRQQEAEQRHLQEEHERQKEEARLLKEEEARQEKARLLQEEEDRRQREAARKQEEEHRKQEEEAYHLQQQAMQPTSGHAKAATVLYSRDAEESNEMTITEGEIITQIEKVDEGWWFGVSEDGKKQGLFPANYVEEMANEMVEETVDELGDGLVEKARCLFDYDAREEDEISLKADDIIQLKREKDKDGKELEWWSGRNMRTNEYGNFPANYVELL